MVERGHAAGPAHAAGDARRRRRARGGGAGSARRRSRSSGRSRRCASSSPGSSARPLHGRTVAVTRARPQASALAARLRELGADGRRGAGDPDRAGRGRAAGPGRLRPRLRHVAERRARAVRRGSTRPGSTRARWPGARSRRSGRARRARCASTACGADVVPARAVAEGLVEALAGRAGAARAGRARPRGPRRAARRAARARRRGRRARALRDGRRAARRATRARPRGADYVTFTSASTVRYFLDGAGGAPGRPHRLDRPGDERGAARGRARARTSRPTRTRPTGWSRRSSPTRRG